MTRRPFVLALLALAAAACSAPQSPARPRGPITARDYFPLRVGAAWSYDTVTGFGGDSILAAISVVRADGGRFAVRSGTHTETYELRPDGVVREGDYILRDPIRVGASWEARDGGRFEVRAVGGTRTVNGQAYRGVIEVLRASPATQIRTTTWYALDVGAIEIDARTTSSLGQTIAVRSTLRGYTLGDAEP